MTGEKCFHSWGKPCERRTVGTKRAQGVVTDGRGMRRRLQLCRFGYLSLGACDFLLEPVDFSLDRIPALVQRPEEECEIDIEQTDQAKSAQHQSLGLFLIQVRIPPSWACFFAPTAPPPAIWGTGPIR